jgi:FecR protein
VVRIRRRAEAVRVLGVVAMMVALLLRGPALSAAAERPNPGSVPPPAGPVVTTIAGLVEVRHERAASWAPVAVGAPLRPGDALRTGARSKAEVRHPLGVIRLFEQTVLRLPMESHGGVRLVRRPELASGQALFDVTPARAGDWLSLVGTRVRALFEVATPHIVSGVKGTRFAVAERGRRSVVAVYEGTVVAAGESGSARERAVLTWGQLAEYEDGRLKDVRSFEVQDDWARWAQPRVHSPGALDGAAAGGGSLDPTRESRLDGGALLGGATATVTGTIDVVGGTVGGVGDTLGGAVGGVTDPVTDAVGGVVDDPVGTVTGVVGGTIGTSDPSRSGPNSGPN